MRILGPPDEERVVLVLEKLLPLKGAVSDGELDFQGDFSPPIGENRCLLPRHRN